MSRSARGSIGGPIRQDHRKGRRRGGRCSSLSRLCLAAMADELKPAYLIAGTDRPKIDRAVDRLRGRFEADAVELHDAAELTGDDAVAACNALGLFVRRPAGHRRRRGGVEGPGRQGGRRLSRRRRCPARHSRFVGGELKKDAPIAKAVGSRGEMLLWDVPQAGSRAGSPSSSRSHERRPTERRAGSSSSWSATISTTSPPRSTSWRPGPAAT